MIAPDKMRVCLFDFIHLLLQNKVMLNYSAVPIYIHKKLKVKKLYFFMLPSEVTEISEKR